MTLGSVESAAQMGTDWVGPARARPITSPAEIAAGQGADGRWLDRRAQAVEDNLEISSQGRKRSDASRGGATGQEPDAQVEDLKKREKDVKAHEQAHMAAGGGVVQGGASYTYEAGPDGKRYVSGGEVQVAVSSRTSDPAKTLQQASQVQRAALAPADPSPQDRAAAAQAAQMVAQARQELASKDETDAGQGSGKPALKGVSAYAQAARPVMALSSRSWVG